MIEKEKERKLKNTRGKKREGEKISIIEKMKRYMEENYTHTGSANTSIEYIYKK